MAGVSAAFGNMEEEKGRVKRQLPQRPKKSDRKALSTSSLIKNDEKIKKHSSASVIEAGERLSLSPPGTKPRTFLGYSAPSDISSNDGGGEDSSVVVAVRVRPFSEREMKLGAKQVVRMHNNDTTITSKDNTSHRFCYDHCFWSFDEKQAPFADQTRVYRELAQPLLDWAFQGYNTCLFAYGQTGSGKSYCIMGEPAEIGIVPQFARELYDRVEGTIDAETSYKVEVSYYEIYKEKIYDLLASSNQKNRITLRVREHPVMGPYVEDLSTYVASSYSDIEQWLALGNRFRATAATGMNDKSSRSHSVFTLLLTQTTMIEGDEHCRVSRINLIDLAGSERSAVSLTSGERLKEGASINKSLHTLGKVISLLSEKSTGKRKKVYIPYRDSTLTWLLKESLGGNSKTAMIATISPADLHHDESLSTLRYAQQARSIVNIARINEDHSSRLIRELRQEIEWLKTQLGFEGDIHSILRSHEEVQQLKEKLNEYEKLMKEMTISWEERLRKTEERKREEADQLKKAGVSFKVDNRQPNLVNLNDDPQLSEMLLYVLKQGDTSVGRSPQCDIQLTAPLVAKDHCVFHNVKDIVSIEPSGNTEAQTFVNGELISGTKVLHHGDRVIIAGGHYFRFNHPLEVDKNTTLSKGHKKDFHYARDEFIKTQTAKLEAERLKERQEMMKELDAVRVAAEEQITQQKHNYEKKLHHLETTLVSKSSEVDEREKEMTEAEEKISQLERINEELREETIAQRHVIEMEKLKAQREYEEITLESSRLMEELALEKQKLEEDIELLQKSKANREKQKDTHVSSIDFIQGSELLRIATMLQEANIISKNLVKPFNFSREEDYDEDQVTVRVRVTNTQENTFTFWDLEKFETRLEQIREIYQHNGSLTSLDHDTFQLEDEWIKLVGDSDPFHDPADVWHQDSFLAGFSPRSSADGGRIISLVSSPAYKGSPHRTLSDITSSIPKRLLNTSSPLVNRSNLSNGYLYDSGGGANEEWSPPINHVNGFIQICYDNVSRLIQHKHRRDVGLIEMIINHVLDFISIVEILQDTSKDDCQLKVLELSNSLHIILNCGNMLEAAVGSAGGDEYIKDCNGIDCCIELTDIITTQISLYCSKLLQSILSDSFDEINENCSNLIESLKEILTAIGKIVLVSHVQEKQVKLVIPPLEDHILSLIQNGYQTWCTAFMDKLLQQLYHYCQRDETPATSLYHQLLIQIVTSIAQFVHKISTLQELFWVPLEGSNIWSLGSLLPLLRGLSKIHSLVHLMFCSGEDLRQLSSCNDRLGQVMEEVGVGILGVTRRVSYGEADGEIQAMVRGIAMATKSLRKMLKEEETKPRTIDVVI